MHHVFGEVPRDNYTPPKIIPSTSVTDAIFGHHVGKIGEPDVPVYEPRKMPLRLQYQNN